MFNPDKEGNSIPSIENEEKFRSHFWIKIQNELGVYVPHHIKNILKFCNLDNPISFRQISKDIISELEKFAQTSMLSLIDKNEDLKKYYGIYYKNPEEFKFVIGEKLLLQQLVEYIKDKPINFCGDIGSSLPHKTVISIQQALNHPIEIDTEAQKKKLQRLITAMMKNNKKIYLEFSKSDRLLFLKDTVVNVAVKRNKNADVTYEAKITCSVCFSVTTITKIIEKERSKTRWILSNFIRHIMTHSANTDSHNKSKQNGPSQAESVEKSSKNEQENMLNGNCTDNRMENLFVADIEEIPTNSVLKEVTNLTKPTTVVGKALGVLTSIENCTGE